MSQISLIIKIIGGILVVGSSGLYGLYLSGKEDYKISDLNQMKKALLILKSEISYAHSTLPEAFLNIAERISPPVSEFFFLIAQELFKKQEKKASQLWEEIFTEGLSKTYFDKEDLEAFNGFGKTVGFLDREMQINSIDSTLGYIEQKIALLYEQKQKNSRLYRSLGILGGILVVVVLF